MIKLCHHNIILMTLCKDILQSFDKEIHIYDENSSILTHDLKNRTLKNITIAYLGHPVSKSLLRT